MFGGETLVRTALPPLAGAAPAAGGSLTFFRCTAVSGGGVGTGIGLKWVALGSIEDDDSQTYDLICGPGCHLFVGGIGWGVSSESIPGSLANQLFVVGGEFYGFTILISGNPDSQYGYQWNQIRPMFGTIPLAYNVHRDTSVTADRKVYDYAQAGYDTNIVARKPLIPGVAPANFSMQIARWDSVAGRFFMNIGTDPNYSLC